MTNSSYRSQLSHSIIRTLLYFDIFSYPLNEQEVYDNLQTNHVTLEEVAKELGRLADAGVVFQKDTFFSVNDNKDLVSRRLEGNRKAESFRKIAQRRGRLIFQFPFVRAVMISGSLSKNFADDKTDIDFFIITAPGRLWVARTFLVLFKRIFLLNSHKYFCVNYFIDESHLEIEEKNLFTATELATLIPLQGWDLYERFIQKNRWVQRILPHSKTSGPHPSASDDHPSGIKLLTEKLLSSGFGNWLDGMFMKLTRQRWKKMYSTRYSAADFQIAFKSDKHVSKNHPDHYQRKVMDRYRTKLEEFSIPAALEPTHD